MIGLLDSEDLIPDEILQKLARFASLADALAVHGTDLKLTEKKAREIVRVLDCVLVVWPRPECTNAVEVEGTHS